MYFSKELSDKINSLKAKRSPVELGRIHFDSFLVLAPLAGITTAPFRLLMEELGAGCTTSELISCHAVHHRNKKTLDMLRPHPAEKNIGIQLFGEDSGMMAEAAALAEEYGAKFIDINMGCPVRKVVTKGGGSALLQDPSKLYNFLTPIKKSLKIPMTVKIRTGWDNDCLNADTTIKIIADAGAEFISLHGRTRSQQYSGLANWEYIEEMAKLSPVPLIGNGDLHSPRITRNRIEQTNCSALMLGRGPLRNPFIFLESLVPDGENYFGPRDYLEVIERYKDLICESYDHERAILVQLIKMIVWFAAGHVGVSKFRGSLFGSKDLLEVMDRTNAYFIGLGDRHKMINQNDPFLAGGHG
ncbi:MAG: tRNA-dihydrouridine synthase [Bacteriovoracaceae bacterium]|nr:tRNA-dihydrouridine synthase [Bacteriovoracaceae bacterium]